MSFNVHRIHRKLNWIHIGSGLSFLIKQSILRFSSPELKAQVSLSDRPFVRLSVRPSDCKLFTFSSSSQEPPGQYQPNFLGKGDSSLFK